MKINNSKIWFCVCLFFSLTIGCAKKNLQDKRVCKYYEPLKYALKNPERSESVIINNYQSNTFPSDSLLKLKNLKCLTVWNYNPHKKENRFKGLTEKLVVKEEIKLLSNLRSLDISWFDFSVIPEEIFLLSQLESLALDCDKIKSLPKSITKLKNLKNLRLRVNHLDSLPSYIASLSALKRIDLANNKLTRIPKVLLDLPNLEIVSLSNPEKIELAKVNTYHNRIDYQKELNTLIALLNKEDMKMVYIEVRDKKTKLFLSKKLKEKGLHKKINIKVT